MKRPIILVYLGKKLPRYFSKNIRYLSDSQHRQIVLITDSVLRERHKYDQNLRIVDAKRFFDGWIPQDRSKYRDYFWEKTLKRLYVLFRFLDEEAISECVHIEGDVWVAPYADLDFALEKKTCLYPKMSNDRGIASIMFVQNEENFTAREFLKYMVQYPSQTDMQLLGTLLQLEPTIFIPLASMPELHGPRKDLFDGAAIGMHLFGEHARNRFGFYRVFHEYESNSLNWGSITFELNNSSQLILTYGENEYVLNTLHLHSKSQKLFSKHWRDALSAQLNRRRETNKEITRFSVGGCIESIADYAKLVVPYFIRKARLIPNDFQK